MIPRFLFSSEEYVYLVPCSPMPRRAHCNESVERCIPQFKHFNAPEASTRAQTEITQDTPTRTSQRFMKPALYNAASSSTQSICLLQPLTPNPSTNPCLKSVSSSICLMVSANPLAYVSDVSSTDSTTSLPSSGPTVIELRVLTTRLRPSRTGVGPAWGVRRKVVRKV